MIIAVPVRFDGMVMVDVPEAVPKEQREYLAHALALTQVLATTDNDDAPEDAACDEYQMEFQLTEEQAGTNWDNCRVKEIYGKWEGCQ